jgi:hypothetical protein
VEQPRRQDSAQNAEFNRAGLCHNTPPPMEGTMDFFFAAGNAAWLSIVMLGTSAL